MPKPRLNKSAFIRNLPADMPAAGRGGAKAKARRHEDQPPPSCMPSEASCERKGPAKSAKRGRKPASGKYRLPVSSSRTQPATMKAGDVVSAGAAKGLEITRPIWSTQCALQVAASADRARQKVRRPPAPRSKEAPKQAFVVSLSTSASAERAKFWMSSRKSSGNSSGSSRHLA